ncbi:hypothetical protein FBQ84_04300 [Ignavibacteria bacterium CHB1]|nr:MAG: hypothetical protein EDM69_05650 [Chlorobiota bacterium]MBV6398462.1 Macrocin O-methyltransferase [Ignavibacteria bacterium]MCC6885696.1 class I SAM-dependent methyltransferase [Ignavibacteriales bacterium]MCE7953109.1 hypothetical protein [Chlorobi bacterium CHB7]MDL1887053.1 hypothetical protein [Ignavibacteria bacterium CHB1]RIK47627.1 MAG: hypothetical protein DCC60_10185 [Ignavibacteriota bacterium]
MKALISNIFGKLGYNISRKSKSSAFSELGEKVGFEFEDYARDAINVVRRQTMLPYMSLITLYEQVVFIEKTGIPGDFVECGVWKGGAVGLMALANLKWNESRRNLHLFDAFEEICAPDEKVDGQVAINEVKNKLGKDALTKGELKPLKGFYDDFGGPGNLSECSNLIENVIGYPPDKVFYHKGWFQNTVPADKQNIKSIAILRLDGDWYDSTKVCIENLYDKVVPGGFVIFDDYGLYEGCKKAVDEFFESRKESHFLNYTTRACRYFRKI